MEKPAIAPPVFVFQKDKAQKRSADGSSAEDGEGERLQAAAERHSICARLQRRYGNDPFLADSDKEECGYCPPVKRERTSSLTQFPPSHSVPKNNVFMPSSFCQSPSGNSDSEPEEKSVGFRLKPPTLIHGQAPSAGVPSQRPKEMQRSVLRPALLQAPPPKAFVPCITEPGSGTNGLSVSSEGTSEVPPASENDAGKVDGVSVEAVKPMGSEKPEGAGGEKGPSVESTFVFGQNIRDRVKMDASSRPSDAAEPKDAPLASEAPSVGTNYFLQYIGTPSSQNAAADADGGAKFVFGQNMSERVLVGAVSRESIWGLNLNRAGIKLALVLPAQSPPKGGNLSVDNGKDAVAAPAPEAPQQEASPEKGGAVVESLEESAAAYTKATAKRCLLEKVEVITGEESESNVLQIQCKLFVFDKISQSWVERGRGLLRLNDMASTDDGTLQSRLVMRTQGSLRLILNTKLWPQMQVDKASEKSIRITAMDTEDQGVKVFLISASSKDTGQLFAALHHRILALRSRAEQESEARPADPEPQLPQSNEEDSEEEEEEEDVVIAPTLGATDLDSDLRRATLKPRMSAFAMFPPGASEGNEAPASGST
ncbi:ran-binding protein 3-like [Scleropages formosus]|uniref:Ran-binding protein 3 n=1 Tax=Scleropages formosus TaxID=113540 RepID=A0A0P7V4J8_SCLFO|nr:ran-binding protein 3-like [Scleropages formosus]